MLSQKRGGPYSKEMQQRRRDEVYKLYFDYGYTASKVAEILKANRMTISHDIQYWYSLLEKKSKITNPEQGILIGIQRLNEQRTRLREELNKSTDLKERLAIERIIFDIDSKITQTEHSLANSAQKMFHHYLDGRNDEKEERGQNSRDFLMFDIFTLSKKTSDKFKKILKEERNKITEFS